MGAKRFWTPDKLAEIRRLRDVQRLTWVQIGQRLNMAWHRPQHAYSHYGLKDRAEMARAANAAIEALNYVPGAEVAIPPDRVVDRVVDRVPFDMAVPAPMPATGRARSISLVASDILCRIAAQGITAGLFGDPPPGRSALDQKRGVVR